MDDVPGLPPIGGGLVSVQQLNTLIGLYSENVLTVLPGFARTALSRAETCEPR